MKTLRKDKIQPKKQAVDVIALLKALHADTPPPTTPAHDPSRTKGSLTLSKDQLWSHPTSVDRSQIPTER